MKIETTKKRIFDIIESPDDSDLASKMFDIVITSLIIINLVLIIADTFDIPAKLRFIFNVIEIITVIVFTIEYIFRLWTADLRLPGQNKIMARLKYMITFMALIDLFSILPFYIPFIIRLDLRILRTLRIARLLRLFKVNRYTSTFSTIGNVFKKKMAQLITSVFIILMLMIIISVLMFNIEHEAQPDKFVNAFSSFWWALATFSTIGYGDIYPITIAGQILNGIFAFLAIGLVAIPTGIISAGFTEQTKKKNEAESGKKCFCPYCGHNLEE